MTRRPTFWIAFTTLGVGGAVAAVNLFSVALPSIALDITMDREAAIDRAGELAERYGWAPEQARTAASFGQVDREVQTYVELEGGGRDAFTGLAEANVYQPYQWRVRRFAERRIEESLVRFTPQGAPYGFELRLAEGDPGDGNLAAAAARAVAERAAADWAVDLAAFEPVESSAATLPGGRVDHTLVYERTDVSLADARFRVRIVVAGDRAAELTHYVEVPEAFSRRYADMRATNDAIALVSQAVFIFVFVLLGAGVGSALLLKRRWIEWRMPLVWGGVTAALFGLNTVNMLPLSWMGYDTAVSATTFMLRQVAAGGAIALLGAPLLAFFFMAGESLGRRAFPHHVQQWRVWNPKVASSDTVLGLTVAAYLLAGIELGYVVLFYLGTSRLEGWWSPADALVQPDLLATYVPWLQAVSISLFASLWEESVFRAVPIACAALLGKRFGRPAVWIWGAVLLQALVFAAGHANYPQQPPYARVVELFLPAVLWGAVYVGFGLVPTILTHFLYDLSLISGVLFASNAMFDQGVIVLVALVPLAVVLRARRREGAEARPPAWAYNRAWAPPGGTAHASEGGEGVVGPPPVPSTEDGERRVDPPLAPSTEMAGPGGQAAGAPAIGGPSAGAPSGGGPAVGRPAGVIRLPPRWIVYAAGAAGAAAWIGVLLAGPPQPALPVGRAEAVAAATTELRARGLERPTWSVLASAGSGRSLAHEYVYEQFGADAYRALTGSYLAGPHWDVRFVDWEADPVDRVEELTVRIGEGGRASDVSHRVPEARAGAALPADAVRALALEVAVDRFGLDPTALREIEAEQMQRPNRTDWLLTFTDTTAPGVADGQARVSVRIAGEQPVDVRRFVHVPEEWERDWRQRSTREAVVTGGLALFLSLAFGAFAVTGVVVWSRAGLSMSTVRRLGTLVLVTVLGSSLNAWPIMTAGLSTEQPRAFQAGALAVGTLLQAVVAAASVGLAGALAHAWLAGRPRGEVPPETGVAAGLLVVGLASLATTLAAAPPPVPDYARAATLLPALAAPLDAAASMLLVTSVILALVAAYVRFRARQVLSTLVWAVAVAGAAVTAPEGLRGTPALWVLGAAGAAAMVWAVVRLAAARPGLVPVLVGTVVAAGALESAAVAAYRGAAVGGVLAAVLLAAMARTWSLALARADQSAYARGSSGSE